MSSKIDILPPHLLLECFQCLSIEEIALIERVSRIWQETINSLESSFPAEKVKAKGKALRSKQQSWLLSELGGFIG